MRLRTSATSQIIRKQWFSKGASGWIVGTLTLGLLPVARLLPGIVGSGLELVVTPIA
jgi:hypothetical protein